MTVETVVVAAPTLVERLGPPKSPADLTHWPHVHDADRKGWSLWFQSHGVEEIRSPRGPSFDDTSLLLKAVLAGQGAGLLPAAMVATEIGTGQLLQLGEPAQMEEFAYYLVCPENKQGQPKIEAFRDWMLDPTTQVARANQSAA